MRLNPLPSLLHIDGMGCRLQIDLSYQKKSIIYQTVCGHHTTSTINLRSTKTMQYEEDLPKLSSQVGPYTTYLLVDPKIIIQVTFDFSISIQSTLNLPNLRNMRAYLN